MPYKKVLLGLFIVWGCLPHIAHGKTYLLNSSYSPPHSTKEQTGYLDLIMKETFRRAGHSARIQMLPAERCLQDSNAGIADGEMGRIRKMSHYYPNLMLVDEPMVESREFVAFSIKHRFKSDGWDSLKPYHVAIMRGWKIIEKNVSGTRSLIKVDTTRSMFKLLMNDRVEVAINARIDGLYMAKQLGIAGVKAMEPPLVSLKFFLFMHKKNAAIIPGLEQALKSMKADGTFFEIRRRVLVQYIE